MFRSFLLGTVLAGSALAGSGTAFADARAGVDAWARGDYEAAIREWKPAADRGDSDAQFNLAQAYKLGRGVPQDLHKAEDLFGKAAAQGHLQASDNFGLLLFQRGERARAMPYLVAAADRGDPRAQYLLGLAYFNGENVPKDWVRAYALVSLAQQSDLAQAVPALAQMDQYIPLDQRQQSVKLATQIAADVTANRARQLAAVDLGATVPGAGVKGPSMSERGYPKDPRPPVVTSARPGADYIKPQLSGPQIPAVADIVDAAGTPPSRPSAPRPVPGKPVPPPTLANAKLPPKPAAKPVVKPAPAAVPAPAPAPAASTGGVWRVQLGAFGVPGNAEALWKRVAGRPELAGHPRLLVPAGRVTKLQAGGFASQADAQAACKRLTAGGYTCIPARN